MHNCSARLFYTLQQHFDVLTKRDMRVVLVAPEEEVSAFIALMERMTLLCIITPSIGGDSNRKTG
jgi:hypothetical protein